MTTLFIDGEPQYIPDGPPGAFVPLTEADALEAENERLRLRVEILQAVVDEVFTSPEWEFKGTDT